MKNLVSKDFVFTNNKGKLEFIGDFEGFYQSVDDPWGQEGKDSRLEKLYQKSREYLEMIISKLPNVDSGCEVGCGLGYVVNQLNVKLHHIHWDGMDISETAIKKAKDKFKEISFFCDDICSPNLHKNKQYDVVILNQILWYILEDLENVFSNIDRLLNKNGYLIISTFFLKDQQYGTEIIGSFNDLVCYCLNSYKDSYKIIHANIEYGDESTKHIDSILVLKKNHKAF